MLLLMKKCHIFIILCLLALSSYPQDTINRISEKGLKEGYWRKLDTAGKKIYEGRFSNGMPAGTFQYYYPTGKVKAVSVFSKDGRMARTTTYFPSGKKMAEGNYIDEKRDSIWQFFSEFDGVLLSEETYRNGRKDGVSKTYYAGKGPAEEITYKDGLKEGPWLQYYSDGKIKMRTRNRNDMKEGMMEAFSEMGVLLFKGKYVEGNPDGIWLSYDDKGILIKKETYEKGLLVKSEEFTDPR